MTFRNDNDSHAHSLKVLNAFYEYDDFMGNLTTVADLGCGQGLDAHWWATRTTRDDNPEPLNIKTVGIDLYDNAPAGLKELSNAAYQKANFEDDITLTFGKPYDFLWCHDSFQYVVDPLKTLAKWWEITNVNGTLALVVKQTTNFERKHPAFEQANHNYYHYTLVNLIHMLAVNGWDCRDGYFLMEHNDPWISAIVYRSEHRPMDPRTTSWFDLAEKKLIPDCAAESVYAHGAVRLEDLVLPWLDKSLTWYGKQ